MKRSSSATKRLEEDVKDEAKFRKTHNMLCGVYGKNINLVRGGWKTDCETTIWTETTDDTIQINSLGEDPDEFTLTVYECGHRSSSRFRYCEECRTLSAYRGFEHEWSHVIFNSMPHLHNKFVEAYMKDLVNSGRVRHSQNIVDFLRFTLNAFDDLRVNSLWHLVFPGSAIAIEERWKYKIRTIPPEEINKDPIRLIFAVALTPELVDQQGHFYRILPSLRRAVERVKGRGSKNMLKIVRWYLDEVFGEFIPPDPPSIPEPKALGNEDQEGVPVDQTNSPKQDPQYHPTEEELGEDESWSSKSSYTEQDFKDYVQSKPYEPYPESPSSTPDPKDSGPSLPPPPPIPDDSGPSLPPQLRPLNSYQKEFEERFAVTNREMTPFPEPSTTEDYRSQAHRTIIAKVFFNKNGTDLDDEVPSSDEPDEEVKQQADILAARIRSQNAEYYLTAETDSSLFIEVKPQDIEEEAKVKLETSEVSAVERLRAMFQRVQSRKRSARATSGNSIDVRSVIQRMVDPYEDRVFLRDRNNRGFAYLILCDMSGSMAGKPFEQVSTGATILQKALDYPFVFGELWGFRTIAFGSRGDQHVDLCLYKFDRHCAGYLGTTMKKIRRRDHDIPVECGGLTPLPGALHVAAKYLLSQTSEGMDKHLFVLTDGRPNVGILKGGDPVKETKKELHWAKQRGVKVHPFVVGTSVGDKISTEMFGPKRMWNRIDGDIDVVLSRSVLETFMSYLRR